MINQNLHETQLRAQQNQQRFNEAREFNSDNDSDNKAKHEEFQERSKHFRTPMAFFSGGTKFALNQTKKATELAESGKEMGLMNKMFSSELASNIINSSAFGSVYGFSRLLGKKQRIIANKKDDEKTGAAGKISRLGNSYSQLGTLAALPSMVSMSLGTGAIGKSLTGTLAGGAMPAMLGIMAAQMTASMVGSKARAKLRPKKISEDEIVKSYSVSQQFQGQISQLLNTGQLQPADMLKLQYLGIIADRVGPLSAIYSDMDLQRQEKEKGEQSFQSSYSQQLYGQDSDKGMIDKTLDFLEGTLTQTLSKFNPFQQITDAIFGGDWNPKRVQEELAEQYGYKDEDKMHRERAEQFGINADQHRLISMTSAQLIGTAPSYESKMIALQSGIFDVARLQAQELTSIRRSGLGVTDSIAFTGKQSEETSLGSLKRFFQETSIPGVNAIANILELPFKLPKKIYNFLSSGFEKVEKGLLGEVAEFSDNQDQVMKDLGFYKTDQQQSTEFVARGLPVAISEMTYLSQQKLTMLENIYEVSNLHYEAFSGQIHERKANLKEKKVWDEIANEYVTQKEYQTNKEKEADQIKLHVEESFRKSPLGHILFAKDWLLRNENTDTDRMTSAGKFFDTIREKFGFGFASRNINTSIENAQDSRTSPESYWKRKQFSRNQEELRQQQEEDFNPKRTAMMGASGIAGLGLATAGFMGAGAIGGGLGLTALLPLLGLGLGASFGIKKLIGEKSEQRAAFVAETGSQEGEYTREFAHDEAIKENIKRTQEIKESERQISNKSTSSSIFKTISLHLKEIKRKVKSSKISLENISEGLFNFFAVQKDQHIEQVKLQGQIKNKLVSRSFQYSFKKGVFERLDNIYNVLNNKSQEQAEELSVESKLFSDSKADDYIRKISINTGNKSDDYYLEAKIKAAAKGDVVDKPSVRVVGEKESEVIASQSKISEFINKPVSNIIRYSFNKNIKPLIGKDLTRDFQKELKEVEEKKKEKENSKFRNMVTAGFNTVSKSLLSIDENTDKLESLGGEKKKGGLLDILGKVGVGLAGLGTLVSIFKLKNAFGIEDSGEQGTGATGSKLLDTGIKTTRAGVNTAAFIAGKKTTQKIAELSAKEAAKKALETGGKKAAVSAMTKTLAKKGGLKVVAFAAKKVPILGAFVGTGLAAMRAMKGDFSGAAMEFASGMASLIPGFGTAGSVAIDVALLARDIKLSLETGDMSKMKDHLTPDAMKLIGNDPTRLKELQNSGQIVFNKNIKKYDSIHSSESKKLLTQHKTSTFGIANVLADSLADKDIVNRNWIGNSEVEDWNKLEKLSENELIALSKYKDFSNVTQNKIKDIIKQKVDKKKQIEESKKEAKAKASESVTPNIPELPSKVDPKKLSLTIRELEVLRDKTFNKLMKEYHFCVIHKNKSKMKYISNSVKHNYPEHSTDEWYKLWYKVNKEDFKATAKQIAPTSNVAVEVAIPNAAVKVATPNAAVKVATPNAAVKVATPNAAVKVAIPNAVVEATKEQKNQPKEDKYLWGQNVSDMLTGHKVNGMHEGFTTKSMEDERRELARKYEEEYLSREGNEYDDRKAYYYGKRKSEKDIKEKHSKWFSKEKEIRDGFTNKHLQRLIQELTEKHGEEHLELNMPRLKKKASVLGAKETLNYIREHGSQENFISDISQVTAPKPSVVGKEQIVPIPSKDRISQVTASKSSVASKEVKQLSESGPLREEDRMNVARLSLQAQVPIPSKDRISQVTAPKSSVVGKSKLLLEYQQKVNEIKNTVWDEDSDNNSLSVEVELDYAKEEFEEKMSRLFGFGTEETRKYIKDHTTLSGIDKVKQDYLNKFDSNIQSRYNKILSKVPRKRSKLDRRNLPKYKDRINKVANLSDKGFNDLLIQQTNLQKSSLRRGMTASDKKRFGGNKYDDDLYIIGNYTEEEAQSRFEQNRKDNLIKLSEMMNLTKSKKTISDFSTVGPTNIKQFKKLKYQNKPVYDKFDAKELAEAKIDVKSTKLELQLPEAGPSREEDRMSVARLSLQPQPQEPVIIPVSNNIQDSVKKQNTLQENKFPIDSNLDKSIEKIFNNASSIFEIASKNYVFEADVAF